MTSTSGDSTSSGAPSLPASVKMLTTPLGKLLVAAIASMIRELVKAVWPGSLTTVVQPAAKAGAKARISSAIGEFQGTMMPATPIGSRIALANTPGATSADVPVCDSAVPAL